MGQRASSALRLPRPEAVSSGGLPVPHLVAAAAFSGIVLALLVSFPSPDVARLARALDVVRANPQSGQTDRPRTGEQAPSEPDRPAHRHSQAGTENLPQWARTVGGATLWSQAMGPARPLLQLPDKSPVQISGREQNGRVPAYYANADLEGSGLAGWVDLDALEAADAPVRSIPSSRGGARPSTDAVLPARFVASVLEGAQDSARETRVPASVTIAQAILESDWGRSMLSVKGQNYFGIKALVGPGPAGIVWMDTREVLGGRNVVVRDAFKAYHDIRESIMDHGRFLASNPRYAAAFQVLDPREFARRIHSAGYATDPAYSTKLIGLMDRFNLYMYDLASRSEDGDP